MGFLNGMDICASGMTAQWLRMDVASENITNADTTRTEGGGPYRRKMVVFEPTNQNASFHKYLLREKNKQQYLYGGGGDCGG